MPTELRPFAEVVDADRVGPDPPFDYHDYVRTRLRAPKEPLVIIPATLTELTGPAYGASAIGLLDDDLTPLATETGYWRLSRQATEGDPGPGLLPGVGIQPFTTARAVETLRNATDGFDIEVSILHPGGVSELYVGQVKGPRIDLVTDAVMRSVTSKEHTASTRIYGLVDNHMLWAWDLAALGQELATHASGRLARLE